VATFPCLLSSCLLKKWFGPLDQCLMPKGKAQGRLSKTFSHDLGAGPDEVSVASLNALAPPYVEIPPGVTRPEEREVYGWDFRWNLLKQRLLGTNADFFCLQEVDNRLFEGMERDLRDAGYRGVMQDAKRKKECHTVGVATFYRAEKFQLQSEDHRSRALILLLKRNLSRLPGGGVLGPQSLSSSSSSSSSSSPMDSRDESPDTEEEFDEAGDGKVRPVFIQVANVHLQGEPKRVQDRFSQTRSTVKSLRSTHDGLGWRSSGCECVVIAGDFNSDRESSPYVFLSTGEFAAEERDHWWPSEVVTTTDQSHDFSLDSAYRVAAQEPRFTYVPEGIPAQRALLGKRSVGPCIDFLFFSTPTLRPTRLLPPVESEAQFEEILYKGLPNSKHGSDHLAIGALFQVLSVDRPEVPKDGEGEHMYDEWQDDSDEKARKREEKKKKKQAQHKGKTVSAQTPETAAASASTPSHQAACGSATENAGFMPVEVEAGGLSFHDTGEVLRSEDVPRKYDKPPTDVPEETL